MIIVKLWGGLGNQIFEYAAGRNLALSNNADLKLDISWFATVDKNYRRYKLDEYFINAKIASREEIKKFKNSKISKIIKSIFFDKDYILAVERDLSFDKNIVKLRGNIYLDGYWQSEKYFIDNRDIIRTELTLKKPVSDECREIIEEMDQDISVSLHIRRGDFLLEKHKNIHPLCSLEYYKKALECLDSKLGHYKLFIFSDDIKWARENLNFHRSMNFVSRPNLEDTEELMLMSKCRHNITANSSFSWWGAWLNSHPEKIVIAPKKWLNDDSKITNDLLPDNWIKI